MTSAARLYVILAREAPLGVVFRRGPTKHVQLVLWCTGTDRFVPGQWFKGRIYERRCDLSPSGEKLIYFAAKYRQPFYTWTAVSRPPFLTALALWPMGVGWGGGGLFASENKILLNHPAEEMQLAEGFYVPREIRVSPFPNVPGWGEDRPHGERLVRDGWRLVQQPKRLVNSREVRKAMEMKPPKIWEKAAPGNSSPWKLQMIVRGWEERGGVIEHALARKEPRQTVSLGRIDWADWDRNGDLLFAQVGRLFRLTIEGDRKDPAPSEARLLIDLADESFRAVETPEYAKDWFAPVASLLCAGGR